MCWNMDSVLSFLNRNLDKIEEVRVGKIEQKSFNTMEGHTFIVNLTFKTLEKYKDKRIRLGITSHEIDIIESDLEQGDFKDLKTLLSYYLNL